MPDRVIENPIINSPYGEPGRHFVFDQDGITNEVAETRRRSAYFVPVPRARKQAIRQLELVTEWTLDRIRENREINEIRAKVQLWRRRGYPDVTPTTRALLEYWNDPERDNPVLFCQRETAETAIYIAESAPKSGDLWIRNQLDADNAEHNNGLPRLALKMATGSGKTVVMAMLIAWQTLNKVANPQDARFAKHFLVITPGITIRDRLRVLQPDHPENYYRLRDLVPAELYGSFGQARIVITNFHALQLRETREGRGLATLTKQLLAGGANAPSPFLETPDHMVARVCREFGSSRREIVVLNDEAHHCYRGRLAADQGADTEESLKGDDKAEAKARNADARVWFTGLERVRHKLGIKAVYDLSATPFFLAGSGYPEGTLFPWVVSDFSLIDAIEAGIVKIPRVPVNDDRVAATVTYRELWGEIRDQLPRRSRKDAAVQGEPIPPAKLEGALHSLYSNYEKAFQHWQASGVAETGETPPVFIVVCNNTNVSKLVFDFIAGWQKGTTPDGAPILVPGRLLLFSNVEGDHWVGRPRTILVDSQQLESGEAMSAEFKRIAAAEIDEFKAEYRERFPGRDADGLTDEDLLREVMNTVGKKGKLGEHVRCVVSVSMLTEGWDANTVTHILGVRAFGTQLLCEQVVGRGLRRRSYIANDAGRFEPEYAEVYGVPFSFIPASGSSPDPKPRRTPTRVHAKPGRAACEITFPRIVGYRVELPDERLHADFGEDSRLVLTKRELPSTTEVAGVVGATEAHTLDDLRMKREQQVAFQLARLVLDRFMRDKLNNPRPWLFPQLVEIAKAWLHECVEYHDDTFPGLLLIAENAHHGAEKIWHGFQWYSDDREELLLPILRPYDPVGTTADVDFDTIKRVYPTDERRCHVSDVVCDTGWEATVAQALETLPDVAAYVKNDHLGFTIPYTHLGQTRQYYPDFLVRLGDPGDGLTRTLIVEVSGYKPAGPTEEKAATARHQWVPAVNNHGGFGRWHYLEITDPTTAKADLEAAFRVLYNNTPLVWMRGATVHGAR
jgi:type III restriction enzyme